MKKVRLMDIRLDGGTQSRTEIDQETIKNYAECMERGDVFPPMEVTFDGVNHWLWCGFHRWHALNLLKVEEAEVNSRPGTQQDAQVLSFGVNGRHGKPRTRADKLKAVQSALAHPLTKDLLDAEIARICDVSRPYVASVRSPERKQAQADAVKKHMERKVKQAQENNLITAGPSEEVAELVDTVNQLNEENQKLKDVIAIGQWDASEIEKIDVEETITELRERIRVLEIDNAALRDSRDMYQQRNAELMRTVPSLQAKLKKLQEK